GLGLYIVGRLMQLAGGRVSAQSEGVGQGATFVLAWPASETQQAASAAAGVVENLRAEGYAVESVADGRHALEWLAGGSCGLVVLDVMLPEIDGFTVCRTLRERGDNTPVLFLTARGDPADRVRGLEAGGDDYLAKPFHLRELLLRVRAILRRWDWYQSASAG